MVYTNTTYKTRAVISTHPSFRAALSLCHLLYGELTRLIHDFPGSEAQCADFVDGLAGFPVLLVQVGSPLAMLALHLAMHITFSKYPHFEVRNSNSGGC